MPVVWQLCLVVLLWRSGRPATGSAGRRETPGGGTRLGDGRGPRPAVPFAARPGPRRAGAADRHPATAFASAGAGSNADPAAVVAAVGRRYAGGDQALQYTLFGPPPITDNDLLHLAHALDDIEGRSPSRDTLRRASARHGATRCRPRGAAGPARRDRQAVVGRDAVVSGLVIALLCRGHVLLEGVRAWPKTLLVRATAAALQLDFKRVQFTPDLMPGDVTGSLVYDARTAAFVFQEGLCSPT